MSDMVRSQYHQVQITGIASAVSSKWQSLEEAVEIAGINDLNVNKFKKSTGVTGRYLAGDYQTTSDFCYAAAKSLIERFGVDREEIGILVFLTQTSDYNGPATACVLHKRLHLPQGCIAFDINQGCSGFVYGLNATAALLEGSDCRYALMLCGDTSAKNKDRRGKKDKDSHSTLLLFGDSGTATLLEKKDNRRLTFLSCTDGNGFDAIISIKRSWRHPWSHVCTQLDDMRVFNFSIEKAPEMIKEYMRIMGTASKDYDALLLHQANFFIMKTVTKRAGFPVEKMLSSIDVFANTSSASIPNTLVREYGEKDSADALRFLCCGFGIGFSWAAVEFNLQPDRILPLIRTDEWFDDGFPEE